MNFTENDLDRLIEANDLINSFSDFLIGRLVAYTHTGQAFCTTTKKTLPPITGDPKRQNAGYGSWSLNSGWIGALQSKDEVLFRHYMADDRGPGSSRYVAVPYEFVFSGAEGSEYNEYLRLKALFEPNGS